MSRLDDAVHVRLQEIRDIAQSGVTELTGKTQRYDQKWESYESHTDPRRFGGAEPTRRKTETRRETEEGSFRAYFPELKGFPEHDRPGAMAAAIEKGKGALYRRLHGAVRDSLRDEVREPRARPAEPRRRAPERPTVPAHERLRAPGGRHCAVCEIPHGKSAHRSHGAGAFARTHDPLSFSFGDNPVSIDEAKKTFSVLMNTAKKRLLTAGEKYALIRARQLIRMNRRPPIGNPPRGARRNPRRRAPWMPDPAEAKAAAAAARRKHAAENAFGVFVWRGDGYYRAENAVTLFKRQAAADAYIARLDPGSEKNWVTRPVYLIRGGAGTAPNPAPASSARRRRANPRAAGTGRARRNKPLHPLETGDGRARPIADAGRLAPGESRDYRGFTLSMQAGKVRPGTKPFWFHKAGKHFTRAATQEGAQREIDGLVDGRLLEFGADPRVKGGAGPLFGNPRGGLVRMGKLVELRYQRDHGAKRGAYRHPFTRRPTIFYDPKTDSILIR